MIPTKLIVSLCAVTAITFATTACQHKHNPSVAQLETQPPSIKEQIIAKGAQVIEQGSRLEIILPTDQFFEPQTTELQENQIETLELISVYLKSFIRSRPAQSHVYVTGYTDKVFAEKERARLSQQYAEVVASFLWSHGFSERQLSTAGFGSEHSIASLKTAGGSAANRRVQIDVLPR